MQIEIDACLGDIKARDSIKPRAESMGGARPAGKPMPKQTKPAPAPESAMAAAFAKLKR